MKLFALAALLLAPTAAHAADVVSYVTDGDTFRIKAKWRGLPLSIRVLGIDAPEHDSRALCLEERSKGLDALLYARELLKDDGGKVYITIKGWDKYGGRVLATVRIRRDGKLVSFADKMIAAGFARPYSGDAKGEYWCNKLRGNANDN